MALAETENEEGKSPEGCGNGPSGGDDQGVKWDLQGGMLLLFVGLDQQAGVFNSTLDNCSDRLQGERG